MAVLKVQENIKQEDGSYAVVHKETEAGLVLFDDGDTFQQKLDAGELNGESGANGKSAYQAAVDAGYTGTESQFNALLNSLATPGYIAVTQKGVANGVASLGSNGKIPASQIPALSYMPANPYGIWISSGGVGGVINFGDEDDDSGMAYVFIREPQDDLMELHATRFSFTGAASPSPNPLPINQGGTGQTTALTVANIQGGTFPVTGVYAKIGTDYSTYRVRNIAAGSVGMTAGSTALNSGNIYLQYE